MIDFRNLKEFEDFEGVDCNIDISLFEYGMVWKATGNPDEFVFVYGIRADKNGGHDRFDTAFYSKSDFFGLLSGGEWMDADDVKSFLSFVGVDSISDLSFPYHVYDIVGYYGFENIFGASYSCGFAIKGEDG